jgi:hypothetical protein
VTLPSAPSPTDRFFPSLLEGDTDETHRLFGEQGDVDDPMAGKVGEPGFYVWAATKHLWLRGYGARLEPVRTTRAGARACAELVIHFPDYRGRKDVALPVAVVGEEAGSKLVRARIYHSLWPLYGAHERRAPALPPDPELALRPDDVVAVYQHALARGDVEAVLATFEPDATVREPSGGAFTHATEEARRAFYGAILADGGIPLEHCAAVDDDEACAIEYLVTRWGKTALPPQPGVAVYVRGPRGKLVAARIYDDVRPPAR